MEVKLSYAERLDLLMILPVKGNFMTLRAVKDLKPKLELTQGEMNAVDMKQEGDVLSWDDTKEAPKKIKFTQLERDVVEKVLKGLEESEELQMRHMDLYEAFVDIPDK